MKNNPNNKNILKETDDTEKVLRYFAQQILNRAALIYIHTFTGFFSNLLKTLPKLPIFNALADILSSLFQLKKIWRSSKTLPAKILQTLITIFSSGAMMVALIGPLLFVSLSVANPYIILGVTTIGTGLLTTNYIKAVRHYRKTPWIKGKPEEKKAIQLGGVNTGYAILLLAATGIFLFASTALAAISTVILPVLVSVMITITISVTVYNLYQAAKKRELQRNAAVKAVLEDEDPAIILNVDFETLNNADNKKKVILNQEYTKAYHQQIYRLLGIKKKYSDDEKTSLLAHRKALLSKALGGDLEAGNYLLRFVKASVEPVESKSTLEKITYLNQQLRLVEEAHSRLTKRHKNYLYCYYKNLHTIASDTSNEKCNLYKVFGQPVRNSWFQNTRLGMYIQYRKQKKLANNAPEALANLEIAYSVWKKKSTREYYIIVRAAQDENFKLTRTTLGLSELKNYSPKELEKAYLNQIKTAEQEVEKENIHRTYIILKDQANRQLFVKEQTKVTEKRRINSEEIFKNRFHLLKGISEDDKLDTVKEKFQTITIQHLASGDKDSKNYRMQELAFNMVKEEIIQTEVIRAVQAGIDPYRLLKINKFTPTEKIIETADQEQTKYASNSHGYHVINIARALLINEKHKEFYDAVYENFARHEDHYEIVRTLKPNEVLKFYNQEANLVELKQFKQSFNSEISATAFENLQEILSNAKTRKLYHAFIYKQLNRALKDNPNFDPYQVLGVNNPNMDQLALNKMLEDTYWTDNECRLVFFDANVQIAYWILGNPIARQAYDSALNFSKSPKSIFKIMNLEEEQWREIEHQYNAGNYQQFQKSLNQIKDIALSKETTHAEKMEINQAYHILSDTNIMGVYHRLIKNQVDSFLNTTETTYNPFSILSKQLPPTLEPIAEKDAHNQEKVKDFLKNIVINKDSDEKIKQAYWLLNNPVASKRFLKKSNLSFIAVERMQAEYKKKLPKIFFLDKIFLPYHNGKAENVREEKKHRIKKINPPKQFDI